MTTYYYKSQFGTVSMAPTPPPSTSPSQPYYHNQHQPYDHGHNGYSQLKYPASYPIYCYPAPQYCNYNYSPGQQYCYDHGQQYGPETIGYASNNNNTINDDNAQNLLPATARVMVGNLHPAVDTESIRALFSTIGLNFVHLVKGGKYPIAFVQFLKDKHAQQALAKHKQVTLYGRCIRIELSRDGRVELEQQSQPPLEASTGGLEDQVKVNDQVLETQSAC
ncbi:uncharacterized protein BDV17DRAFT_289809 [Aspergillus undulatus]|uniref:uncharacterized protein n=1 Tax=Aspergillus undulatus TaxID=1810928 RepID=UPI003CCD0B12